MLQFGNTYLPIYMYCLMEIILFLCSFISQLYTDVFFYQMYEAIDFVTESSIPPYVYEFCYDGSFNMFKKLVMHDLKIKIPGNLFVNPTNLYFQTTQAHTFLVKSFIKNKIENKTISSRNLFFVEHHVPFC